MNLTLSLMSEDSYKHITDAGKKFLALVIPKSWKYTVLMEADDKLGHQGISHTYYLIKCQYHWERDEQGYLENILQTVFFANEKKLKFNNTHYR